MLRRKGRRCPKWVETSFRQWLRLMELKAFAKSICRNTQSGCKAFSDAM